MSEDLPEGWAPAPLSDLITELRNGISTRPSLEPPGTPILRISAARPGGVLLDDQRYLPNGDALVGTYGLRDNDLLFTRYNGSIELLGVCGMVRGLGEAPLLYPDKLMRVRVREQFVLPAFVEAFFQSPVAREAIMGLAKSSAGQQGISGGDLKAQSVPVAPLPEQRRIVEKVEALFEQVNQAKARLDRVPFILKRFRQSVLSAACSGGPEREVGTLIESVRYGTAVKCSSTAKGTPVLRIPNVVRGEIDHTDMKYGLLTAKEKGSLNLEPGDLLMIRSNGSVGLVGKTALVTEREAQCSYAGYLMRLRPDRAQVVPEYLQFALQTYDVRVQIEMPARSTSGVHNVNSEEVKALRIYVPPLVEQLAAIKTVRALFTLADSIERRVQAATARADKLPQAILSKAFSGELVPTEAELARVEGRSCETAEELLKRVITSGAEASANGKARRPRARKAG